MVTAVNDYQKERQFQSLNSIADDKKKVTVKRDGIILELHQDFLLVGDIVQINEKKEILRTFSYDKNYIVLTLLPIMERHYQNQYLMLIPEVLTPILIN